MPSNTKPAHATASTGLPERSLVRAKFALPESAARARIARLAPPLLTLVCVLGLWQLVVRGFGIRSFVFPAPWDVAVAFGDHAERLLSAGWFTLWVSTLSFATVLVLGTSFALLLGYARWAERAFYPYAVLIQATPVIAIAPIIIIWFGLGWPSIVAISTIIAIFAVIANTAQGLVGVDKSLTNLFELYGASKLQTLLLLKLPFALPNMVTGWRIAGAQVVVGAIVGEYMAGAGGGAHGGIGLIIAEAAARLETPYLFAAALTAALMGVSFFLAVNTVGNFLLRNWHPSADRLAKS